MVFGTWLPSMSVWLKLVLQIVCGAFVYIVLAAAFRLESFCFLAGHGKGEAEKMMENEVMKKTVIVTAIGSFSAQNVIAACHKAGMRVVGCDIYPAEWVVNSRDVDVFYRAPYATGRNSIGIF